MSPFDFVAVLLSIAAVFGVVNDRWIGLPRPISLLIGALGLSLLVIAASPFFPHAHVAGLARELLATVDLPRVLLDGMLAFLLFAASLHVDIGALWASRWMIFGLATGGVLISTPVFGALIWGAFQLTTAPVPLLWCFTLAAILAPTDAVAVEALLRPSNLPKPLQAAITGESLFNDGVGVVIYFVALSAAQGARGLLGHGAIASALVTQGVGGFFVGLLTGWIASQAMRLARSLNLALTISLALVLGTYRLADLVGVSGPIAVVAAGLLIGHLAGRQRLHTAAPGEIQLVEFWTLIDELLNALLFLLIGFEMLSLDTANLHVVPIIAAIPLAIAARAVSVAIPLRLLGMRHRDTMRTLSRAVGVLTWTGLRGGVSVALALTLPASAYRSQLLTVCYTVVVYTVIVQGLTMPAALRLLVRPPGSAS